MDTPIACITGGTGMVGQKIVDALLALGVRVRVLSRNDHSPITGIEFYKGHLLDDELLSLFLRDANMVFHCAAELHDESLMWETNVKGTEALLRHCKDLPLHYFCYLSSAGVIGRIKETLVTENSACQPQNRYEQSKWAAEQLVKKGLYGVSVVILRPTNVVDENKPGALAQAGSLSLKNRILTFIKGAECAHLVHATDVANAALFLREKNYLIPECFFVSLDHEPLNTLSGLSALIYAPIDNGPLKRSWHLPLFIPYLIRRLRGQAGNIGNVQYSSQKLCAQGFRYRFDLKNMIAQYQCKADNRAGMTQDARPNAAE